MTTVCIGNDCRKMVFPDFASASVDFQVIELEHEDEDGDFSSSSLSMMVDSYGVPDYLIPKKSLEAANISKAKVNRITLTSTGEIENETTLSSKSMIESNTGEFGSIAFVVRRPGCFLCREQGQALTILAAKYPHLTHGFNIFGIIKEIGVDDKGLREFYNEYFPFPLYLDSKQEFYRALGDRKLGTNLLKTVSKMGKSLKWMKRAKEKKITGNFLGEGFIQGGVIVFNEKGEPTYAYEEQTGIELPVGDLVKALNAIRRKG